MPKIKTRLGNTYDTDRMCDGELLTLAMSCDHGGDLRSADKVHEIRDRRMRKGKQSCGDQSCCW